MKYKQAGGRVPKGMRKKTTTHRSVKKDPRPTGGHGRRKTGAILDPSDERKHRRKVRRAKRKLAPHGDRSKMQGGGMIEESKEIKFGGPHKMKKGGAPGSLKRAAKKTAKGKANIKKGMDMLGKVGQNNTTRDRKPGEVFKDERKATKKAARTMKRGIRQKKAGARKKANYEFRQAVKRGEVRPTTPPIGNLGSGKVDKKFLGGIGRIAGAIKGFRGGKGQGLGARLKGAAKGAAGGGMMGRAVGALKGMRGAAGQGGGLRGMMKAGAQGAMQGAFGGGAQQNAAEAAPAEGMEEEMKRGGMKDRRKMQRGGCKKGQPCEAYDGGRGPKKPKKRRKKNTGFKTRVRNIGRRKYENGGSCGPGGCDQGGGGKNRKNKKYEREAKRAARRRARNRGRGRGRPKV